MVAHLSGTEYIKFLIPALSNSLLFVALLPLDVDESFLTPAGFKLIDSFRLFRFFLVILFGSPSQIAQ